MPRKLLERSDFFPYHVCARSNNRDWFNVPLAGIYELFATKIERLDELYGVQIHAFVLMSNHFHLILSTPKANLDSGMRFLMTESSRGIARMGGRINKIYGSRYSWTIIKEPTHYAHAFRYVYQNPLRANMVSKPEDYTWSTLNPWHKNFRKLLVPNQNGFDEHLTQDRDELTRWLNILPDETHTRAMKKALRRREFKFPRGANGFPMSFDDTLLRKNMTGTF